MTYIYLINKSTIRVLEDMKTVLSLMSKTTEYIELTDEAGQTLAINKNNIVYIR